MEKKKRALERAGALVATALLVLSAALAPSGPVQCDATPRGVSYRNFDYWGGAWSDAEKSPYYSVDGEMCWAATAANVLDYTGWGHVGGMSNSDSMFAYYVDHWTNIGGLMDYAWNWWFDGTNDSQGWSGWSQVSSAGGGFYPSQDFWNYYHEDWTASSSMISVDQYLHMGCGVGLAIYGPGAHAITCWGYSYDPLSPSDYYGIWVSDSDDDKSLTSPPDRLRYYDVTYSSTANRWYIQDFYGSNGWYIGGVEALELIPEPATMLTLMIGLTGLALRRRYHR